MSSDPKNFDLESLSAAELRAEVISLRSTVAKLVVQVEELMSEISRLKGLKGKPQLKPSGMEKGTADTDVAPGDKGKRRQRRRKKGPPKSQRLIIDDEQIQCRWRRVGGSRATNPIPSKT